MTRLLPLLILVCLAFIGGPALAGPEEDLAQLHAGVKQIGIPGLPGTISVFGPDAFPILTASAGKRPTPVVAGARLGKGRVVAFGHNGWFGSVLEQADGRRFLANVCQWASGGKHHPRVRVARFGTLPVLLGDLGPTFELAERQRWHRDLEGVDVLCVPIADMTEAQGKALEAFVRAGGGVVSGLPGWGWKQLNPGKDLATANQGNLFLAKAGVIWGSDTIQKPGNGLLPVAVPDRLTHAGRALESLVALDALRDTDDHVRISKKAAARAVATVTRCVRDLPEDDRLFLPRLGRLLKRADDPRFLPSATQPLTDESGLGKLLLTLQIKQNRSLPVDKVKAHAAARHFPGPVPAEAKRVTREVAVDPRRPDWHGTGLYAVPGEPIRVTLPAGRRGWKVRIGAHKDLLWGKAAWRRVPEITRVFPLTEGGTQAVNAFGGPIYIVVPKGRAGEAVRVRIEGAVEAPRFVLGQTTLEDWRTTQRQHPAPWAELETDKVILTVPSAHVRALDDPQALLQFWDRVLDADADLATIPHERARPERFVTDEQISVGYMHAGYPIMTHLDAAPRFVDLAMLSTKGDWGMFHELGHNHQHRDWTFGGTIEVTVNLFTLYVLEHVCTDGKMHEAMSTEQKERAMALHRTSGRSFEMWKQKPFLALIMYHQLLEAFGWDAYKQVFAEYRDLSDDERPENDDAKRDQWMVRFSKAVNRDLGPFFEAWGVPVSAKARAEIAPLEDWMPAGFK